MEQTSKTYKPAGRGESKQATAIANLTVNLSRSDTGLGRRSGDPALSIFSRIIVPAFRNPQLFALHFSAHPQISIPQFSA